MSIPDKFERPVLTADIAVFTSDNLDDLKIIETPFYLSYVNWKVFLIKRKNEPWKDYYAIPGGCMDKGETWEQTARRELLEETGLVLDKVYPGEIKDNPNRDPRGKYISRLFYAIEPWENVKHAVAMDDAKDGKWFYLNDLPEKMAADHREVLDSWIYYNFCLDYSYNQAIKFKNNKEVSNLQG